MPHVAHRVSLTNTIVKRARWDDPELWRDQETGAWRSPSHRVLWDDKVPGLGLRLRATGAVWIVRVREGETNKRVTLKRYTERERPGYMTIPEARKRAREVLAGEIDQPASLPVESPTLAEVWERFKDTEFPRLAKRTEQDYTDRWTNHLGPTLGDVRLDALRGGLVIDMHAALRDKPTTANRVVALLSNLWGYARARGETPDGRENPARAIDKRRRHPEAPRKRVASTAELRAFLQGVDSCPDLRACERLALLLVPYALLRPIEIVRLRWSWVDLDGRTITLPASEAKGARISGSSEPEVVVLAKTIAERLSGVRTTNSEHVVPSVRGGGMFDVNVPWHAVKKHAELPDDLIWYDFKRTSLTLLRDAGVPDAWRHAAARHREQGVQERHYAAANVLQARKAIDKLEKLLAKARK